MKEKRQKLNKKKKSLTLKMLDSINSWQTFRIPVAMQTHVPLLAWSQSVLKLYNTPQPHANVTPVHKHAASPRPQSVSEGRYPLVSAS